MSAIIFKAGTHRTMDGRPLAFSEADIAAIAAAYDPAAHEAPVVIGHPKTDDPAMGWVSGLNQNGPLLTAEFRQLDPAFAEAVNAGRFRHVSAAFYPPDSPRNPKPGVYYLRHVGVLGAMPPAVKGLGPLAFAEDDTVFVAFGEDDAPPATPTAIPESGNREPDNSINGENMDRHNENAAMENAALKRELEELKTRMREQETMRRHADNAAFAEGLVEAGKLAPADRAVVVATLDALSAPLADGGSILFSEGENQTPLAESFRSFLSSAEPSVMFGEFAVQGGEDAPKESPLLADARRRAEAAAFNRR